MERFFIGTYYLTDGSKPIETKVRVPLEWIVLEKNEKSMLLLSKDVIDWELYGDKHRLAWEESYMRKYLCEHLYQSLFSKEERNMIITGEYGPIFLLSKEEIKKYLPTKELRKAVMYDVYKHEDGEIEIHIEKHAYWLRPTDNDISDWENLPIVETNGEFDIMHSEADEMGVRIAMYIDAKQAEMLAGKERI